MPRRAKDEPFSRCRSDDDQQALVRPIERAGAIGDQRHAGELISPASIADGSPLRGGVGVGV